MTRVPPATGSSRQLHSLSKPDAGDPHAEARIGPRLEALDPRLVAQQAEAGPRGAGRRGRRPGRRRRPEPQLREERRGRGRIVERRPDRRAAWRGRRRAARPAPSSDARRSARRSRVPPPSHRHRQPPIGCQTVFISRKAAIHSGRSAAASSSQSKRASATVVGRREQALDVLGGEQSRPRSACRRGRPTCRARRRRRGRPGPARARSRCPVRTLTTPPGTSDVARTSVSVTAGQRPALAGDQHDRVAGHERRREPADETRAATTSRARRRRPRRSARGS